MPVYGLVRPDASVAIEMAAHNPSRHPPSGRLQTRPLPLPLTATQRTPNCSSPTRIAQFRST